MSIASEIKGTGSYLPEKVLTNDDLSKMVDTSDEWIFQRVGIKERRIAADSETTSDLAANAAIDAIQNSGIDAEDIDLIIVATLTPDKLLPSTATQVQRKINAKNAAAFDLAAACSGFIYGLTMADQFIKSGFYKNILIIGVEILSRCIDWQDRNTCVLFGDGAGAAILSANHTENGAGIKYATLGANGFTPPEWLEIPAGGTAFPASEESLHKNMHFVTMNGKEIFKFGVKILPKTINSLLDKNGYSIKDIDMIIPHQANVRIVEAAAKKLGIHKDKFFMNIDKYANTSAATIPIALDDAIKQNRIKKGDKIILIGFGGGLTWGAVLYEW
ncbi:MAG: ketoacyl-ACP synthase III [Calditrichales bacterium]|nr:ketoacyl-ACP synthase III [Calditrichales bacterium]